jgi:Ras-related protein Rab-1A
MGGKKSKPAQPPAANKNNNKQPKSNKAIEYKLLIVGDAGVGKTNLLTQFTDGKFSDQVANIGEDFKRKDVTVNGQTIQLQIWDTAGQEKFRKITFGLYRGAHGIILAYDITKKATLDNLDKWLKDITDYGGEKVTKIVAGNKTDLETERVVTTQQGQDFAEAHKLGFIETSAKSNKNVEDMFQLIANKIFEAKRDAPDSEDSESD